MGRRFKYAVSWKAIGNVSASSCISLLAACLSPRTSSKKFIRCSAMLFAFFLMRPSPISRTTWCNLCTNGSKCSAFSSPRCMAIALWLRLYSHSAFKSGQREERLSTPCLTVGQAPFPWKLRSSSRQLDPKSIAPANTTMAASSWICCEASAASGPKGCWFAIAQTSSKSKEAAKQAAFMRLIQAGRLIEEATSCKAHTECRARS
mmetsp:Transcript_44832/g.97489  ORF Transcript_44832/g.97489 Transcript_44832/m.97489 type:complete len:205 (-) Transcript_44832:100-714(-)